MMTALLTFTMPMVKGADEDVFDEDTVTATTKAVPAKVPAKTTSAKVTSTTAAKTSVSGKNGQSAKTAKHIKPIDPNEGNGKVITVDRVLPGFCGIYASGKLKIVVTIGDKQQIKITTDENLIKTVKTNVDNGRLDISLARDINPTKLLVELTMTRLNGIWLENADVAVSELKGDTMNCELVGDAVLKLSGTAMVLRVSLNDKAKLYAADLAAFCADIRTKADSMAEVRASDRLKVVAFGHSRITYFGRGAAVNQKAYESGVIKSADHDSSL